MTAGAFDDLTDIFESLIDWPKRLANEGPFFRQLFARLGATRILDAACGTGHHVAMFHSWDPRNFHVEGADISPRMIDRARATFGEPPGLRWTVRGYDQPAAPATPFDVAICVGNSLALAGDLATAYAALRQMLAAIRPGGAIFIQVRNVLAMPDGPCAWQPPIPATLPDGPALIIKGLHRCGQKACIDLLVNFLNEPAKMRTDCIPFLALEAPDLERLMKDAGARRISFFGSYQQHPFIPEKSPDLLMLAEKS